MVKKVEKKAAKAAPKKGGERVIPENVQKV
jgi:hypothetical protein